jgi:hypothetical protein
LGHSPRGLDREDDAAKQFEIMRNWEEFMVLRYWRLAQIEKRRGNNDKARLVTLHGR